jgi:hypothetical protein
MRKVDRWLSVSRVRFISFDQLSDRRLVERLQCKPVCETAHISGLRFIWERGVERKQKEEKWGVQLHSGTPEARKRKGWFWNVDSHVRGSFTIDTERMLTSPSVWSPAVFEYPRRQTPWIVSWTWAFLSCCDHDAVSERILTMVYVVQSYWSCFGLYPSSCMWKTKYHNISETGSVSVLRWMGQDKPTQLGLLERASLNHWSSWEQVRQNTQTNFNKNNRN